eukprot:TRINITY_DN315_c0_g1_i2.p1 TRINITY_DN315_c0_g1~~TRINITY_DN315_c0_g1_i2.p1  ORF type:complete len:380 (-),score=90.86 TRINITY_DN315_c0_g1_i2:179-1318(-)
MCIRDRYQRRVRGQISTRTMQSSLVLLGLALTAVAYAAPVQMINDQAVVDKINNNTGLLWKAGMNTRFNNLPRSAMKSLTGVKADSWGMVQAIPRANFTIEDSAIPESFDSEANWPKCAKVIGDIRDQSMCGCCWAFAGASAASDRLCISTDGAVAVPLSAQDICFCSNSDGCDGGQISTPWDYIASTGAVTGGQQKFSATGANPDPFADDKSLCSAFSLPHCHHHGPQGKDPFPAEGAAGCPQQTSPSCPSKCDAGSSGSFSDKYTFSGQTQSASGETEIQKAIMTGGPVETAFTVYVDFANYVSGIYHHVSGGVDGGHAVRIVGWGVEGGNKYWKVANSWNPYWGEKGYFRIKRGNSECGIEDGVTFSAADAKWTKK